MVGAFDGEGEVAGVALFCRAAALAAVRLQMERRRAYLATVCAWSALCRRFTLGEAVASFPCWC